MFRSVLLLIMEVKKNGLLYLANGKIWTFLALQTRLCISATATTSLNLAQSGQ